MTDKELLAMHITHITNQEARQIAEFLGGVPLCGSNNGAE